MEADSPADDPGRQGASPGVPGVVTRRSLLGAAAVVGVAGQALSAADQAEARCLVQRDAGLVLGEDA